MKKITPSDTRTFCTNSPFGRTDDQITSPTGSGSIATSSKALAMERMRSGVSRRRSTWASVSPKPGAAARSAGSPEQCRGPLDQQPRLWRSHPFFWGPVTRISPAAACLARRATSRQYCFRSSEGVEGIGGGQVVGGMWGRNVGQVTAQSRHDSLAWKYPSDCPRS